MPGYAVATSISADDASGERAPVSEVVVAGVATAYTVFLLYAAGPKYMLLSFLIYAPGSVLFVMSRREQGRKPFEGYETVILAVSVIAAVASVVSLVTGWIEI